MVRQGLSTKLIATTLNLSTGTIGIHRKHIRKKLELDSKEINLYSYLTSLIE
jgi:DNA-binding CsgD family transcriptional regulator